MKASEIAAQLVERELRTRRIDGYGSSLHVRREMNKIVGPREPLLDPNELCAALGVCKATLNSMIKDGLPSYCLRGNARKFRRFKMSEVEAWLRANSEVGLRDAEDA